MEEGTARYLGLSSIVCPWRLDEHSSSSRNLKRKAVGIVVSGYRDVVN